MAADKASLMEVELKAASASRPEQRAVTGDLRRRQRRLRWQLSCLSKIHDGWLA